MIVKCVFQKFLQIDAAMKIKTPPRQVKT